jgi:plastocyanin
LSKNIIFLPVVLASVMSYVIFCHNMLVSFGDNSSIKSGFPRPSDDNTNASEFVKNVLQIHITQGATSPVEQVASSDYFPKHDEVKVQSNVTWINDDTVVHTVSSQDKKGNPINNFDSGNIDPHGTWSHIFDKKQIGMNYYYCKLHPYMKGTINVTTA